MSCIDETKTSTTSKLDQTPLDSLTHFFKVWNAKLTETQIFSELSIEIESSLIELKSSLIQLKSSLIQLESSLIQLESSLFQLESSLIQLESSLYMYN